MSAMSLCELQGELESMQRRDREVSRAAFVRGVWEGRPASELLALSKAAGLAVADADALVGVIRGGKGKVAIVDELPRLRKEALETKSQSERIHERHGKEIARLEEECRRAAYRSDDAFKALCQGQSVANELLLLHDQGLLPVVHREVLRLVERRTAEGKSAELYDVLRAAENVRSRCRGVVGGLEARLASMPLTMRERQDRSRLEEELAQAKRNLADAEAQVAKAQVAAEKSKRAIPAA